MNIRFFFRLLAITLLTINFASCSESSKEDLEPNLPTEFTPSDESATYFASGVAFAGNGGEVTISFTCNKKWKATSTKDWCEITPQKGESGYNSIGINVEPNESLENRDAVITLVVGEQNNYIAIKQSGSTTGKFHVENAGSLPSLLSGNVTKIKELTISGKLNGTDFKLLRQMSGNLVKLDLSETHIVEGGESYFYDTNKKYYIENDVFPYWALGYFVELQEIKLPKSIFKIDDYAFFGCLELKDIEMPHKVKDLGDYVFCGCSSLENVSLPQGLECIPIQAFYGCSNLKKLILPENLDSIGTGAFGQCTALEEIQLNKKLRAIKSMAFYGCSSLKKLYIPQSVTHIGISTFDGCVCLEDLTLYENVENCIWIFGDNCGIKRLNLFFKELPALFLSGCKQLETLILNEGLEVIDYYSLENAPKLKELTIPSTIKEIKSYAFSNNLLERLHLKSENPPKMSSSYEEHYNQCTLFVPKGSKDAYVNAGEPWTLFKDIIEE